MQILNKFYAHKNAHYPTQHEPVLYIYGSLRGRESIDRKERIIPRNVYLENKIYDGK